MIYAPVVIPTLCRSKHFINCIESLKANSWAQHTEVFIALDYPLNENHKKGYEEIVSYIETSDFSAFKNFNVVKREKNYGVGFNAKALLEDIILVNYDRWIFLEDDIITSKNFIEYMDKCLDEFENDDSILAINGYSYPLNYKTSKNATILKQRYSCSTWGIGFWKKRYLLHKKRILNNWLFNKFDEIKNGNILSQMIDCRYYDYMYHALTDSSDLMRKMSDMAMGAYLLVENMFVVTPVVSKTMNAGFDGSGVYCQNISRFNGKTSLTYNYLTQPIDDSDSAIIIQDLGEYDKENRNILNQFLVPPKYKKRRVKVLLIIYHIFGRSNSVRLWKHLRRIIG